MTAAQLQIRQVSMRLKLSSRPRKRRKRSMQSTRARILNHLVEPICPIHGIEKTRKGKPSETTGEPLLFCQKCVTERERAAYARRQEKKYKDDAELVAKMDAYLAQQAEAVRLRRLAIIQNAPCCLGFAARASALPPVPSNYIRLGGEL